MCGKGTRAVLILTLAIAPGAAAQRMAGNRPTSIVPSPVLIDTVGMFIGRAAKVGDDLFITGQPTMKAFRELKAQNVTMVVNLRTPPEIEPSRIGFDERALVKELGMEFVDLPMRGNDEFPFSPEAVRAFDAAMKRSSGKVLLHCAVAWRASHLYAAYLIQFRNVPVGTALDQARSIALMDDTRSDSDKQPVEQFLGRDLSEVAHPRRQSEQRVTSRRSTMGFELAGSPLETLSVDALQPESDAAKQGLRNGDRILSFNGSPAASMTRSVFRAAADGTERVKVVVLRDGKQLEFSVLPYRVP